MNPIKRYLLGVALPLFLAIGIFGGAACVFSFIAWDFGPLVMLYEALVDPDFGGSTLRVFLLSGFFPWDMSMFEDNHKVNESKEEAQ